MPLRVLSVASEIYPLIKTGGLADVTGALPLALESLGIEVRSLDFDLEGELDLHGFLGLSNEVRAGYDNVRVTYRVDCDAEPEAIGELCEYVQRTSPVMDMLRNPVEADGR